MKTTIKGKPYCDHCLQPLPRWSQTCPHCGDKRNQHQYPMALQESTILAGKYVVGKVLGKGGFGITYLCYDVYRETLCAVKEYFPATLAYRVAGNPMVIVNSEDKEAAYRSGEEKFFSEAKLVSQFNGNPNVVSVFELFEENNTTYFVMEYLQGVDLKQYIQLCGEERNGLRVLREEQALHILMYVNNALTILHNMNPVILHRDISPDNIFICRDGRIKLIDFGAARQLFNEESNSLSIILKMNFAPAEQYQKNGRQGPWTDIYALGATMYYALTGNLLDDAMTRMNDDTLNLDSVSPEFAALLTDMLKIRVDERIQNTMELAQRISQIPTKPQPPVFSQENQDVAGKADTPTSGEGTTSVITSGKTILKNLSEKFMRHNRPPKKTRETKIKEKSVPQKKTSETPSTTDNTRSNHIKLFRVLALLTAILTMEVVIRNGVNLMNNSTSNLLSFASALFIIIMLMPTAAAGILNHIRHRKAGHPEYMEKAWRVSLIAFSIGSTLLAGWFIWCVVGNIDNYEPDAHIGLPIFSILAGFPLYIFGRIATKREPGDEFSDFLVGKLSLALTVFVMVSVLAFSIIANI